MKEKLADVVDFVTYEDWPAWALLAVSVTLDIFFPRNVFSVVLAALVVAYYAVHLPLWIIRTVRASKQDDLFECEEDE